ncbi:MAG: GNAT family N-acetyltransferase [archaeon]
MKKKIKYSVRELTKDDLDDPTDFLETLSNLTEIGELPAEKLKTLLDKMNSQDIHVFVVVTEDGKIIGSTSVIIEQKFAHSGYIVGHIEDVCTRKGFEGLGVGSAVIKQALEYAKKRGCYRVILDCYDKLMPFYEKFGFKKNSNEMRLYF